MRCYALRRERPTSLPLYGGGGGEEQSPVQSDIGVVCSMATDEADGIFHMHSHFEAELKPDEVQKCRSAGPEMSVWITTQLHVVVLNPHLLEAGQQCHSRSGATCKDNACGSGTTRT